MKIMIIFILVLITTAAIGMVLTYLSWNGLKRLDQLKDNLNNWSKRRKVVLGAFSSFLFFCLLFFTIVVPTYEDYGITETDIQTVKPDSDWLPDAKSLTMHAIDIDAPPEEVWKWIVQVGGGRAGWYSYDWAENIFGYGLYNSYDLREEWQPMSVGQILVYNKNGDCGFVSHVEPNKYLVSRWDYRLNEYDLGMGYYPSTGDSIKLRSTIMMPEILGDPKFLDSYGLYIEELPNGKSRLVTRCHLDWDSNPIHNLIISTMVPIMHAIMDLEMINRIKACAEGRASEYTPTKLPKGINPKPSDYETYYLPEGVELKDL